MDHAIEINGLTKRFRGFTLDHVSFTLPRGCIMGLIGENGAGKTTVIKQMLGILAPDEGSIRLLGESVPPVPGILREDIGVVMDEAMFPYAFHIKHVNSVMKDTFQNWEEDTFYQYCRRFALPENKAFKDYSRGMKMKLSIAAALSHGAKLLILDEATSGLDPIIRDEVLDIFYDFTRDEDHSILISSHIVSDLEKLCDYITFLHQGKLLFSEEKDALLDRYGILHCNRETFDSLPADVVRSSRGSQYEISALVEKAKLPAGLTADKASIEDIIIYLGKEAYRK